MLNVSLKRIAFFPHRVYYSSVGESHFTLSLKKTVAEIPLIYHAVVKSESSIVMRSLVYYKTKILAVGIRTLYGNFARKTVLVNYPYIRF